MKYLALIFVLSACKTTVDYHHWDWCQEQCGAKGLKKAGHHWITLDRCCECFNGDVILEPRKPESAMDGY
jgi:hypothetical protein